MLFIFITMSTYVPEEPDFTIPEYVYGEPIEEKEPEEIEGPIIYWFNL